MYRYITTNQLLINIINFHDKESFNFDSQFFEKILGTNINFQYIQEVNLSGTLSTKDMDN